MEKAGEENDGKRLDSLIPIPSNQTSQRVVTPNACSKR